MSAVQVAAGTVAQRAPWVGVGRVGSGLVEWLTARLRGAWVGWGRENCTWMDLTWAWVGVAWMG